VEQFGADLLGRWNAHDPDGVVALCTEDVHLAEAALPVPVVGRAEARQWVADAAETFPDYRIEAIGAPMLDPEEPLVLWRFRMTGTMLGPWRRANLAPTGARIALDGVDEWHIRDGRLARGIAYYDGLALSRQLGVLPPSGGALERMSTRAQHGLAFVQRRVAARSRRIRT